MDAKTKIAIACCLWALLSVASHAATGGDLRLVEAAKNQDAQTVQALLKEKVDVNSAQADGTTALAWAAHWDDLGTADILLRAGAKPNLATEYGVTPLSLACTNGSAPMVAKLLAADANPNVALTRTGVTPLMTCSRTGSAEAVKQLLERGANANTKETWRGQTALMWAVEEDHIDAARLLIQKGADVRARTKSGFTPLLFAARHGSVEMAKMLLDAGASVTETTPETGPALMVAAASGHEKLAIFLLEKGADPNVANGYGFTPLHYSAQKGLSDLSAVPYRSSFGPPPNMPELAKALLGRGANPNARITREYPAHTRAPFRQTPAPTVAGATPYYLAAASGDANLMHILAAAGADPKIPNRDDTTPLMVAAGLNRVQDFLEGEESGQLEAVKLCVESGVPVNVANKRAQTALHGAAVTGANAILQFLVEKGADLNATDKDGQTPISIAKAISPVVNNQGSLRVHDETANLLLKLGAKPLPPGFAGSSDVISQNPAQ